MTDSLSLRDMFVPMLGLIGAVLATLIAVLTAVFGPFKKLRLPVESVPGSSRGVLNLVLFAPFLVTFLLLDPIWAKQALFAALVALVFAFICYQKYGEQLNLYRYTKPHARSFLWFQWNRDEVVIGGGDRHLTSAARARRAQTNATVQHLLKEAEHDADRIWTRQARVAAQLRIERWYYGFMLCAVLTIVMGALAGQTLLSGEAPLTNAKRVWAGSDCPTKYALRYSQTAKFREKRRSNWGRGLLATSGGTESEECGSDLRINFPLQDCGPQF